MFGKLFGALLAVIGAFAMAGIALQRDEHINSLWLVTAAICVYAVGYRFYAKWIETRVFVIDKTRATPAERLNNGRDFLPTHRWVVFGHHFAAIAGAGPLVGPTLAMQFGYLPGTLWLLVGSVIGGCVQDMTILFMSSRRNGKSLGQMARDELGALGGTAAVLGTLMIVVIIIAVLGLVGHLHGVCHHSHCYCRGLFHAPLAPGARARGFVAGLAAADSCRDCWRLYQCAPYARAAV
jgi:carbon starvation protein